MRSVRSIAPRAQFHYHNPIKSRDEIDEAYRSFGCRRFAADGLQDRLLDFVELQLGRMMDLPLAVAARHGAGERAELFQHVIDAFEAPPLPQAILSPSKKTLALLYRCPYPTIAELSRPMLRLVPYDDPTPGPPRPESPRR